MALIYCVEDDAGIRELISCALGTAGHSVKGFVTGEELFEALPQKKPELILLDIMLPVMDGITILRKLKSENAYTHIPVIMLTAKTQETDKVLGLETGADDYITKPFGVLEFIARVKAVLRRSEGNGPVAPVQLEAGGLVLDYGKRTVTYDGKAPQLTYKEFELLTYLMRNKGLVLTRDTILEKIWGYDFEGESRTIDMHIKTLRQKLRDVGCPDPIKTIRGAGYKFEE